MTANDFLTKFVLNGQARALDPDLRPKGFVTGSLRSAGVEVTHGTGGWWRFIVETHPDNTWKASVFLDDGQESHREGRSDGRKAGYERGRIAVTEMIMNWADVRQRVRRAQNYVECTTALRAWTPPAKPAPEPSWLWMLLVVVLALPRTAKRVATGWLLNKPREQW